MLVGAFIFLSSYGHFYYFWSQGGLSWRRVFKVWLPYTHAWEPGGTQLEKGVQGMAAIHICMGDGWLIKDSMLDHYVQLKV